MSETVKMDDAENFVENNEEEGLNFVLTSDDVINELKKSIVNKIEPNSRYYIVDVESVNNKYGRLSFILHSRDELKYYAPPNLTPFLRKEPTPKRFVLQTGDLRLYKGFKEYKAPCYRIATYPKK